MDTDKPVWRGCNRARYRVTLRARIFHHAERDGYFIKGGARTRSDHRETLAKGHAAQKIATQNECKMNAKNVQSQAKSTQTPSKIAQRMQSGGRERGGR